MKTNLLFFLNSYADLQQTTTPYRNNFKWTREINGIPYNVENSQQIQIPAGITSPNIVPYAFSTPVNSGTYAVSGTSLTLTSATTGLLDGQLIVGSTIPVDTRIVSIGTTQYTFTVTSANATSGAVYSNNGQNFTVVGTISGGTTLVCTGASDPLSSGTLTKVSGTGDATITFSAFTESTTIVMSRAATASGSTGINIYSPAGFVYIEADQLVSMIYNNGSPVAIEPFQINGLTIPGVFFLNGPAYSITITNLGASTANIFFASMG